MDKGGNTMRKIIIALITVCAVIIVGSLTISVFASINMSTENKEKEKDIEQDGDSLVYDEFNNLTEEQIAQIEELRKQDPYGHFWYQEMIIKGEVEADAPKLDLETAKSIIAKSSDFTDIMNEFESVQSYPDYSGGSGVSLIKYWLDETGNDVILIIYEQAKILHISYDDNGNELFSERLY